MSKKIVLETRDLGKDFGSLTVLDSVNFKVAQGESVAVTGPSGSGKSTLLGLLAGLEEASRGEVRIEDQNISAMGEESLSAFRGRRIGFVFQSYRLLPTLNALENIRVPLDLAGNKDAPAIATDWLKRVGLLERATHLPGQLSGGEQQRIALARALAPSPSLILADEPTGNLDTKNGLLMQKMLFDLVGKSGASMVMVTHDLKLAKMADRVIRFRDGKIVK